MQILRVDVVGIATGIIPEMDADVTKVINIIPLA